jgi:two-component system sensor kinase FixL
MGSKQKPRKNDRVEGSAESVQAGELKRARGRLADSEVRLQAILKTAVDGIITIDERGIIESANAATERIFGYSGDELVGSNISLLMPQPHRDQHDQFIARYLQTGQAKIIGIGREVEGQRKDGTIFPIDLAVSEIKLDGCRLFTGVVRDISARRLAEEEARRRRDELAHAARLSTIGELTSGIAHEVNQPLTAMVSFGEACLRMLRSGSGDARKLEDALQQIVDQGQRAGQIIRHLRRLARKSDNERVEVDISRLVRDVIELTSNEIRANEIALSLLLDEQLPTVMCDRVQIEQVVLNLIRNAMDALEDAPSHRRELTVHTRADSGNYVLLTVEDTGRGFDADKNEQIFETFFTTKAEGLGIGLSISRSIVEDHGGRLWATPRPGGGSIFYVSIPGPGRDSRTE